MDCETDSLIQTHPKSIPEIIDKLGFGRFQHFALAILMIINSLIAIESFLVGVLIYILDKNWALSENTVSLHSGAMLLSMCLGCLASGIFEDKLTRWGLTKLALIIVMIFSIASSLSTEIISFTIFRMIVMFGTMLILTPSFSSICEMLPTKGRGYVIAITEVIGISGYILIASYSYIFIRDLEGENWRLMNSLVPIPLCIVCLGLCYYLIEESPVYCAKRDKHIVAIRGLNRIAELNNKSKLTTEEEIIVMNEKEEIKKTVKVLDLFSKDLRRQTSLILVIYALANNGYNGVLSVYLYLLDQEGNEDFIFLNFAILIGFQIPGMIMYVLLIDSDKAGRKRSLQIFSVIALTGIALPIVYYDDITIIIGAGIYVAYKFVLNVVMLLYTAELYTTELRNSALAYINVAGRFFVIWIPYVMLAIISIENVFAFVFLAILEVIGLFCITLLKYETKDVVLDTSNS